MYTLVAVDTCEGRCTQNPDKTSGPLEAQAQVVVRHPKGGLGNELESSSRAGCTRSLGDLSSPYEDS